MRNARSRTTKSLTAALGVTALLALSACGGDKPAPADPPKEDASSSPAAETSQAPSSAPIDEDAAESPSDDAASSEAGAATGEKEELKASSGQAKDPALGHTASVTGIVLGFKGEGDRAEAPGDNQYVGVKVKATAGSKYITGVSCTQFKLWDDKATRGQSDSTSLAKDAMEKQGLTPLDRVRAGESGEGWCMYYTENPTKDNLSLEYSRSAARDSKGKQFSAVSKKLKITPQG